MNGRGNTATGTTGGHDAVKDPVYQDVQCESCHGPGLEHVEGVGQGNLVRPLASLSMTGAGNCSDYYGVRAIVESPAAEPLGELIIWIHDGFLAGLEYAWYTDEPPNSLPEPTRVRTFER